MANTGFELLELIIWWTFVGAKRNRLCLHRSNFGNRLSKRNLSFDLRNFSYVFIDRISTLSNKEGRLDKLKCTLDKYSTTLKGGSSAISIDNIDDLKNVIEAYHEKRIRLAKIFLYIDSNIAAQINFSIFTYPQMMTIRICGRNEEFFRTENKFDEFKKLCTFEFFTGESIPTFISRLSVVAF